MHNHTHTQSRDAIIDSTHPCTREEAIQFAALQCQVQYGNHNEAKHKPGFLDLNEFLPREYTKLKAIEKNIFADHRKLHNLSELNAKFRYIQLCRSLRTYGVTFFLVKVSRQLYVCVCVCTCVCCIRSAYGSKGAFNCVLSRLEHAAWGGQLSPPSSKQERPREQEYSR